MDLDLAQAFFETFEGNARFHGVYILPKSPTPDSKGKITSPSSKTDNSDDGMIATHTPGATRTLWMRHMNEARFGLGIVPIMDNGLTWWGAIDVDVYPVDIYALNTRIQQAQLPLILCRSKSGGAHLYLFMHTPVPAARMRAFLARCMGVLGYSGLEIFPKQESSDAFTANPNARGSWINMPYQGGLSTNRYALGRENEKLSAKGFLALVAEQRLDPVDLAEDSFVPAPQPDPAPASPTPTSPTATQADGQPLPGGPPCLNLLATTGFGHIGYRNNFVFNLCVYYKKANPDGWQSDVMAFVERNPTVNPDDAGDTKYLQIKDTMKSVAKRDYNYKCKDAPITMVCDRTVCLTCPHGVTGGKPERGDVVARTLKFGGLRKILSNPVRWEWDINAVSVTFSTKELNSYTDMKRVLLENIHVRLGNGGKKALDEELDKALANLSVEEPFAGSDPAHTVRTYLETFCTGRTVARIFEEILLGKAYTEEGVTMFRPTDFLTYLKQNSIAVNEMDVKKYLEPLDVGHHTKNVKGALIRYWSVSAFAQMTAPLEVPSDPQGGAPI